MSGSNPKLTEAAIRSLASPQSFSRGQTYFRNGAVLEIERRDDLLLAQVEGSSYEPYRVTVKLDAGGVVEADCTCPYDWGGYCKHIVAVLLTYIHQPGQVVERRPAADLLADLDREALVSLVAELLTTHPHLADWVEGWVATWIDRSPARPEAEAEPRRRRSPLDPQPFRHQVRNILRSLSRLDPSEAYWATGGVVAQVREVMNQAEPFLAAGDGRNALVILEAVADEYVGRWFEFDDSDGKLGALLDEMGPLFAEAILSADLSPAERQAWADRLTGWQEEIEDYGIDEGFNVAITAARLGWDHPPLQRAMQGHATDREIGEGEASWYADELMAAYLNVLEHQGRLQEYLNLARAAGQTTRYLTMLVKAGRGDQAVVCGLKSLASPDEALALAQTLRQHDRPHDALRIAGHGLTLPGTVGPLAHWLRDFASGLGQTALALQAARAAFGESPSLADYQAVHSLAGDTWPQLKGELLDHVAQTATTSAKVDIYLHEGLVDQAVQAIDQDRYAWYDTVEKVVDAAWQSHPDWVIRRCRQQAEPIMDQGKSQQYHDAVRWLEKAQKAYRAAGREAEWRTYLESLISKHIRKYSLRPQLEALLDK